MRFINRKTLAIAGAAVALVAVASTGTAVAGSLIGSSDIQDDSIRSIDVKDGSVKRADLSNPINRALARIGKDGVTGKDGKNGKDGIADVNSGAGYTHNWNGDGGATLNTIVSKCDAGQVALGGGFSTWGGSDVNEGGLAYDLGGDNKNIQVTVSAPYTGKQYDENQYHGGILPDRWVVKGYNTGTTDQIVRAWVICADAN